MVCYWSAASWPSLYRQPVIPPVLRTISPKERSYGLFVRTSIRWRTPEFYLNFSKRRRSSRSTSIAFFKYRYLSQPTTIDDGDRRWMTRSTMTLFSFISNVSSYCSLHLCSIMFFFSPHDIADYLTIHRTMAFPLRHTEAAFSNASIRISSNAYLSRNEPKVLKIGCWRASVSLLLFVPFLWRCWTFIEYAMHWKTNCDIECFLCIYWWLNYSVLLAALLSHCWMVLSSTDGFFRASSLFLASSRCVCSSLLTNNNTKLLTLWLDLVPSRVTYLADVRRNFTVAMSVAWQLHRS